MIFPDIEQAVMEALERDNSIVSAVNYIGRRGARNMTAPYIVIEPLRGTDWGVKDRDGHELRLSLNLAVPGADPERLLPLLDAVAAAMRQLPQAIGGWQVVTATRLGTRTLAPSDRADGSAGSRSPLWLAAIDYRLRVIAAAS